MLFLQSYLQHGQEKSGFFPCGALAIQSAGETGRKHLDYENQ